MVFILHVNLPECIICTLYTSFHDLPSIPSRCRREKGRCPARDRRNIEEAESAVVAQWLTSGLRVAMALTGWHLLSPRLMLTKVPDGAIQRLGGFRWRRSRLRHWRFGASQRSEARNWTPDA